MDMDVNGTLLTVDTVDTPPRHRMDMKTNQEIDHADLVPRLEMIGITLRGRRKNVRRIPANKALSGANPLGALLLILKQKNTMLVRNHTLNLSILGLFEDQNSLKETQLDHLPVTVHQPQLSCHFLHYLLPLSEPGPRRSMRFPLIVSC